MANKQIEKKTQRKLPRSVFLFRAFLIFIVILMLVVIAAESFANVTFSNVSDSLSAYFETLGSGDGYPYTLNAVSVKAMDTSGSDILLLTDKNLTVLDKTAKTRSAFQHTYASPRMASNNGRTVVYDRGGKSFRIQSKKEVLYETSLSQPITVCNIGKSGNTAIATFGTAEKSVLTVYNSSFSQIFKWNAATEYIVAVALSPNGKSVAVAAVSADTGEIYTKINIFDFDKNEPVGTFVYNGVTIVDLIYTKRNVLVAVGDKLIGVIKNNTVREADISYDAGELSRYAYNSENGTFAVFLSKFGGNSSGELRFYGSDASLVFSKDINNNVRWIDCGSKFISVLQDGYIRYFTLSGKDEGRLDTKNDAQSVYISGNDTYILAVSEIRSEWAKNAEIPKE